MTTRACPSYAGHRFPPAIIGHAVWLYFRFALELPHGGRAAGRARRDRDLRDDPAVGAEVRPGLRERAAPATPAPGDKWHLDEVFICIAGVSTISGGPSTRTATCSISWCKAGATRGGQAPAAQAAQAAMPPPRVMITDKLASYGAARREVMPSVEHRQHKGPEQPGGELAPADPTTGTTDETVQVAGHAQLFLSAHDQINGSVATFGRRSRVILQERPGSPVRPQPRTSRQLRWPALGYRLHRCFELGPS